MRITFDLAAIESPALLFMVQALERIRGTRLSPLLRVSRDLPEAVRLCSSLASQGDIVLFSPGAASYDRYPNYEVRGEHFVESVRCLPQGGL